MPGEDAMATWILRDNCHLFLERVAARIANRFDDWDWDAIRFGIQDTDDRQDRWYEYELIGMTTVALALAEGKDADRLHVRVQTEGSVATRISAIARIMQCRAPLTSTRELEILVGAAFIEMPRPSGDEIVSCSAAHLAKCPEHQETLSFFRVKHWLTRVQEGDRLPNGYADLGFLTPQAVRFFFPAYLIAAIREHDEFLLDMALRRVENMTWTPLQGELIDFAQYLFKQAALN
jgi:hypothetical protein